MQPSFSDLQANAIEFAFNKGFMMLKCVVNVNMCEKEHNDSNLPI